MGQGPSICLALPDADDDLGGGPTAETPTNPESDLNVWSFQ